MRAGRGAVGCYGIKRSCDVITSGSHADRAYVLLAKPQRDLTSRKRPISHGPEDPVPPFCRGAVSHLPGNLEGAKGIEPSYAAWEASCLLILSNR